MPEQILNRNDFILQLAYSMPDTFGVIRIYHDTGREEYFLLNVNTFEEFIPIPDETEMQETHIVSRKWARQTQIEEKMSFLLSLSGELADERYGDVNPNCINWLYEREAKLVELLCEYTGATVLDCMNMVRNNTIDYSLIK